MTADDRPFLQRFFAPDPSSLSLWPRWIVLRGLGLVYLSAFVSLYFQIDGLIGPNGITPAGKYLAAVASALPRAHLWYAPTLFWFGSGHLAMHLVVWGGLLASIALVLDLWPRASLLICLVCFLSFVSATEVFSSYQSDGMLLEAGFIALFFAPPGFRPGLGRSHPPSRAALFLLQWEWFRIYFESGVVKILSGDPEWRTLTAMDHYYENGPLPTWIGWYAEQLPHWFHAATAALVLFVELVAVWMLFVERWPKWRDEVRESGASDESDESDWSDNGRAPGTNEPEAPVRRFSDDRARGRLWRIVLFFIVTPMQIGIILTANYAFLNYIVLLLGVLLLDDRFFARLRFRRTAPENVARPRRAGVVAQAVVLSWVFMATVTGFFLDGRPTLINIPAYTLQPFRFANAYGLFAVMTRARYEIEFQGSVNGGKTWVAYPFRFKPQDPKQAPGIYAPYQPRFEWNLWFASLGNWRQNDWVVTTEERLLERSPGVLELFRGDPFHGKRPDEVRAVLWQYWFTDLATKRKTDAWWRREYVGEYAPVLAFAPGGSLVVVRMPTDLDTSP